jgi:hypothetical protein
VSAHTTTGMADFELGQDAVVYLREFLGEGNSLSARLLDLPLERGLVRTYLPQSLNPGDLKNFTLGGLARRKDTAPKLLETISRYLAAAPKSRLAVFEDALARNSDPFLRSARQRFVSYEGEIYYVVSANRADKSTIIETTRRARSFRFVCVLTESDEIDPTSLFQGQRIPRTVLDELGRKTHMIIVSAFDGEADIYWQRR